MRLKRNGSYTLHRKSKKEKEKSSETKKLYLELEYARAHVTDCDFRSLVRLPPAIDRNEWLATYTTTFFNHVNLQYSTVSEFCTSTSCPCMTIPGMQLYWQEGERGKKLKCTGPQYVDYVMCYVQRLVTDEKIFPTKYGRDFPNFFNSYVQKIFRYLFHVLAHVYWAHFRETVALDVHSHLNSLYAHLLTFCVEFSLLPPEELALMAELNDALLPGPRAQISRRR
ncbi:MOB kinase activator 2-like isoform X1 [Lethenteron reissneri]|uniref:MOB kinase activator 2-like isoform X1 n=1 Tax=Lethenteron reissneri TaxID=7753 RepID=UPI002AB601D2|nr:MOB kinase activator 2-like isoform X1 [Lethenteron reissneri]